jgi:hypothetical protein
VNYHLTVEFVTLLRVRLVSGSNLGPQVSLHSLPLSLQATVMTSAPTVDAPWIVDPPHTHIPAAQAQ